MIDVIDSRETSDGSSEYLKLLPNLQVGSELIRFLSDESSAAPAHPRAGTFVMFSAEAHTQPRISDFIICNRGESGFASFGALYSLVTQLEKSSWNQMHSGLSGAEECMSFLDFFREGIDLRFHSSLSEESTNSTVPTYRYSDIFKRARGIFANAEDEIFEDGMVSGFSREFTQLTTQFGSDALQVVEYLINWEKVSAEAAAEALRLLGEMNFLREDCLQLLLRSLKSSDSVIRDGAILGLSMLEDPRALPDLISASSNEKIPFLRQAMQRLVSRLEDAVVSKKD